MGEIQRDSCRSLLVALESFMPVQGTDLDKRGAHVYESNFLLTKKTGHLNAKLATDSCDASEIWSEIIIQRTFGR